ncbi:hypothetical protein [Nostoc sp.]|nr:hypothetical protein [Nostoc sp. S13]
MGRIVVYFTFLEICCISVTNLWGTMFADKGAIAQPLIEKP